MPSRRNWVLFELLVVVVIVGAFLVGLGVSAYFGQKSQPEPGVTASNVLASRPLREVWDYLHIEYYGVLPSDRQLTYGSIRGMLAETADPYTVLVDPDPHTQETEQLQGHYGGIGATLSRDELGRVRVSPFADGPAEHAGIQLDDILLAIDGTPVTTTATIDALNQQLRGDEGTHVRLALERPGTGSAATPARFEADVIRAQIAIPSVTARLLRDDPSTGYVGVSRFSGLTDQELRVGVNELRAQGARRLILDLRNNGGGLLDGAVKVASQFMASGTVLYEVKRQNTQFFPVEPGGVATDLPLVVVVNGNSASAAEVVAGALQDSGRAPLVGEKTYGKGSVQLVFDLRDGSSLHVTTAKWLTPSRRSIDGTGLTPDVVVPLTQADRDAGRDPQIDRALELLQTR